MRVRSIPLALALLPALAVALASCGGSGGLPPVTNDPLAVPPDYAQRPPRVGNGTEDALAANQFRQTVFRLGKNPQGSPLVTKITHNRGERVFLRDIGIQDASPNIRTQIASGVDEGTPFPRSFVDKLLVWQRPVGRYASGRRKQGARPSQEEVATKAGGSSRASAAPGGAGIPTFVLLKSHSWLAGLF